VIVLRRLVALAVLALAATVGSANASDPWARLHRPLHLPTVASGAPCPVSGVGEEDFGKYGVADGIGAGPAYAVGFSQPGSVLSFDYPPDERTVFAGSRWSGQKVLWFVSPSYRGRVLIRGARLDANDTLRFEDGKVPPTELRIPIGSRGGNPPGYKLVGQRYRPSFTRLRAPGCYAYQVDGTSFSRVIVFRAEPNP
jgi:hypothetical protein